MTTTECWLITAIAVAQSDEPELLDNDLYRLTMDKKRRAQLDQAIRALRGSRGVGRQIPAAIPSHAIAMQIPLILPRECNCELFA